ncbi:MAG: hypothetical protein AMJ94_08710 [Deltaproteobacteria bacterium SM23_61]|nr:MAG: hypothetical protein AMJ94_08710 [Deltaproteobacteria bacterium SM23_61]
MAMAQSVGEPKTRLATTSNMTTKKSGQMAKPIMMDGFSEMVSAARKKEENMYTSPKESFRISYPFRFSSLRPLKFV